MLGRNIMPSNLINEEVKKIDNLILEGLIKIFKK